MKRKENPEKSLWNVYIFDSHPITKKCVSPAIIPVWRKKWLILGNWYFYVFSFGNWANVIWVMKMKSHILLFQGREVSLFLFHPPSVILNLFFFFFFVLHLFIFFCMADCMSPYSVEKAGSYHPFLFVLYLFLSIRLETRWQPFPLTGSSYSLSCHFCLVSLSPFQTYSSQYLPVLSKCYCKVFQWDDSKYVYINRGNTLGYILLTPLCCVVSFWSPCLSV